MKKLRIAKFAFDLDDKTKDFMTNKVKTSQEIEILHDIVYDPNDPQTCNTDIYYPKNRSGKLPVMLNIHGGGWITGDKYWRRGVSAVFADMNIAVVTINYGICPQYRYPTCLKHCYTALDWIHKNADEYGFDKDKIFISGDSAGGGIAAMLAATQNNKAFREKIGVPDSEARIYSGILICGAYDPEAMAKIPFSGGMFEDMTGLPKSKLKEFEFYDTLSPYQYIDENFPKNMLIAYGSLDAFVGGHQIELCKRLKQHGVPYEIYRGLGAGEHCFHLYVKQKISKIFYKIAKEYLDQMTASDFDGTLKLDIPKKCNF